MDIYSDRSFTMTEEHSDSITVVDVYDQAASIGKEFEKLIETFGVESVTDLMPKVIKSLEQLELLAARYEKETNEISDLKVLIDKLEAEKNEKAQERLRYEQELEQIEENWHKETKELMSTISQLQEENRSLRTNLNDTKQAVAKEVAVMTKKTEEKEIEVLTKLKDTVDKQREELRKVKREAKQKSVDCEALEAQLEQIVKVNAELRRKNSTQKKQTRTMMEEKVDLEAQLADKEQQITQITEAIKEQELLEEEKQKIRVQKQESKNSIEEDVEVENHVEEHLNEEDIPQVPTHHEMEGENMAAIEHKLSTIGKIVIDMSDPNRPRFTLNELRTVLMERNELKSKLMEVEDELASYKPKPNSNSDTSLNLDASDSEISIYRGEDLPVQGPINKEPDEKLNPRLKRESGIRKFFKFVFGSPESESYKDRRRHSQIQ